MPAYLIRLIENHDLVGIFVAKKISDLFWTIDECTDPDACEYVKLPEGGIMWTSPALPIPIEVPEDDDGGDPDPVPWASATFTEIWWNFLHGFENLKWKPVMPSGSLMDEFSEPPGEPKPSGPGQVVPFKK